MANPKGCCCGSFTIPWPLWVSKQTYIRFNVEDFCGFLTQEMIMFMRFAVISRYGSPSRGIWFSEKLCRRRVRHSTLTGKPLSLPAPMPTTCPNIKKNTAFCRTKCTCPWSWLSSCNAQLSYLCVECYNNNIIIIIMIIMIIIIII